MIIYDDAFSEVDPAKKDYLYADKMVTIFRREWKPIVDSSRAYNNKKYLDSAQEMDAIKAGFKDKKFLETVPFDPLGIMEPFKNALVEELTQNPPKAELKAVDPSAITERQQDIELLRNRKVIEGSLSKYQTQVGLPPYKVAYDRFKGNVEEFDKMGLDEGDPDDVNFFETTYHRLGYEIAGQAVINGIMRTNRFDDETIQQMVRDILSVKAITLQTYVDKISGEIKYKYLYPETTWGILGDSKDGRDDICKGWQENLTLQEFLQMVGNEFNFERDWKKVLMAINFIGVNKYTGFLYRGVSYDCCTNVDMLAAMGMSDVKIANLIDWSIATTFKVATGFIEWKSNEATATYLIKKNDPGFVEMVPFSYSLEENHKKQIDEYQKTSFYQQQWYSCHFLSTSMGSQVVFNFGKVYYQTLHGANDEYSNGSLTYYREEGKSAVEIAKPFITLVNKAFYKMLWVVDKAKVEEDQYLLDELIQLAQGVKKNTPQGVGPQAQSSFQDVIEQLIQYQRENVVRIRAFPKVDGKTHPQLVPLEGKQNGVDPIIASLQLLIPWGEQQISQKIGVNPMRLGMNPPSRESQKSEQNTIQYSFNTTGYVYRMLKSLKQRVATITLNYAQDIIKFKDSIPYKWLTTLAGNTVVKGLELIRDFAPHRYGIFIRDFNLNVEKQKVEDAAFAALQQKTLTYDQWFVVTQTEDYKRAHQIISYLIRKNEKKIRDFEMQKLTMQDQMNERQFQRELKLVQEKGKADFAVSMNNKEAARYTADANAQSRIAVKQITVDAEPEKQDLKAQGQKEIEQTKKNLEEQRSLATVE